LFTNYKDAIERQKYRAIERRDLQMFAGIASGEGGDFYPLLAEVGKGIIQGRMARHS
jgi:hypothetical protein